MEDGRKGLPLWAANLFVFSLLFCVVTVYFLWQIHQAKKEFLNHVEEHAALVAQVVQLSARGSVLAQRAAEEILESFLGNTARFVDYLDRIEPFTPRELTAFSRETGLAGIRIHRGNGEQVEGPAQWLPAHEPARPSNPGLEHLSDRSLYLFSWSDERNSGQVVVGMSDAQVRTIQEHLGLDNVVRNLAGIPRIGYVKVAAPSRAGPEAAPDASVTMKEHEGRRVAEALVPVEGKEIAVALDAGYLNQAIGRLWRDFFFFSAALALLGAVLSIVLYRRQAAHLTQIQKIGGQLALERENAALGRSAAAIAHEVRNPLNVLNMGLQRLLMEGRGLSDDNRHLVDLMLGAVKRANTSVEGLLKYARAQKPFKKPMRLDLLLENMFHLYEPQCEASGIRVTRRIAFQTPIPGDPDLLGQVVENLLKNAIEAQPGGGTIHVEMFSERDAWLSLKLTNRGFTLKPEESERILEPYFTTKPDGTGLGLTISRRIVEAHGGRMTVRVPKPETLEISIELPATASENSP
ncbi:ATPase/histidine kinase/DNA gyrase B/HSP90 domain protein [uncultured Desulfatiglans sp.]|uniref:histidine kinase n=1 Tax=Uncultured Desulfatiglans sp. TaxID=1748965 RepID=A0A653A4F1_UNCDX|nr:ATPase/histidine kinase/DNA gyrase B/HSP90 domain protein [uncultured Desulfatiglans sp.]